MTSKCKNINNEGNPNWNPDSRDYDTIHGWVNRKLKRPNKCPLCNKKGKLDLCYKDHSKGRNEDVYDRDLNKWEFLCRSCHMKADGRMNNLKQFSEKFIPEDVPNVFIDKVLGKEKKGCSQCENVDWNKSKIHLKPILCSNQSPSTSSTTKGDTKTLSSKTIKCVCGGDNFNRRILYHEKDVKDFIKDVLEIVETDYIKLIKIKAIKEKAGERLIKLEGGKENEI